MNAIGIDKQLQYERYYGGIQCSLINVRSYVMLYTMLYRDTQCQTLSHYVVQCKHIFVGNMYMRLYRQE